jgi:putative transposase
MADSSDIRHGRHVVYKIHVHLVFVPKYRYRVFATKHLERMRSIFEDVCRDFGATLAEMNGEHDHVHLLVEYPPQVAISNLVNSLKGVSSRLLRKEFPDLRHRYYNGVLWSPSYFAASCGGAPLSIIKQYIEQQRSPG